MKNDLQDLSEQPDQSNFVITERKKLIQMRRFLTLAVIFLLAFSATASAQKVAVKTNALYLATATPNVGFEFAMAPRWTFELAGGYNPWTFCAEENIKAKHFLVTPEFRYWFCEAFQGHFIGINGNYTEFNVSAIPFIEKLKQARIQGWAAGAGLTYGYAWPISRRWNMEFTVGLGCWYTEYDKFESRPCGLFQDNVSKFAPGLTDLGLSFIYLIK